ncbi:uncharacterized protein LOC125439985 isoform X1 [Sphaerodactylus townsendi]|uniref:uncharacterized protein LOC125439985 isoform X1 n=1 Tax=Sphaerodactylus townsendi TaxID=933632 RepID=UPI002025C629|nr:uncharacterized protein LOC125439985 isoform X1 [Sphaerodactylus townsendi]
MCPLPSRRHKPRWSCAAAELWSAGRGGGRGWDGAGAGWLPWPESFLLMPASPPPLLEGLPALPASALTREPLLPLASDSQGLLSLGSSLSSASLSLRCFPHPPPPPPPVWPDLGDLTEAVATLLALQAHHLQDRKRDLRSCQECLKSIRALRVQLRSVRKRLSVLEEQLGIQVPPRELDADEQEEEKEEPALDAHTEEPEEIRT